MFRRTTLKIHFFRLLAIVLFAIGAGFVVPESNLYSADKTFVKSHTPAADNFASRLRADDGEDVHEDQVRDIQLTTFFSIELITLVVDPAGGKIKASSIGTIDHHHVYILNRQLVI